MSVNAWLQQLTGPPQKHNAILIAVMEWHIWVGPRWFLLLGGSLLLAAGLFGLIREYFRRGADPAPAWRMRRILVGVALSVVGIANLILSRFANVP
jgi:hypothetical protein